MSTDFGDPVYVDAVPEATGKGGRKSITPAMEVWLGKIEPGKTAQLPSKDEDGGHPVSRVSQLRKAAGTAFKIETRPIIPGKRYAIYATVNGKVNKLASANGTDAPATAPDAAPTA